MATTTLLLLHFLPQKNDGLLYRLHTHIAVIL